MRFLPIVIASVLLLLVACTEGESTQPITGAPTVQPTSPAHLMVADSSNSSAHEQLSPRAMFETAIALRLHESEPAKALALQRKVLALLEAADTNNAKPPQGMSAVFAETMACLRELGQYTEGIAIGARFTARSNEPEWLLVGLDELANLYIDNEDFEQGIDLHRKAVQLRSERGRKDLYFFDALRGLGTALAQAGRLDTAAIVMQQAVAEPARWGNDFTSLATAYRVLASIYAQQARFDDAARLTEASLANLRQQNVPKLQWGYAWVGIGNLYMEQQQYDSALTCFERSLDMVYRRLDRTLLPDIPNLADLSDRSQLAQILQFAANAAAKGCQQREQPELQATALNYFDAAAAVQEFERLHFYDPAGYLHMATHTQDAADETLGFLVAANLPDAERTQRMFRHMERNKSLQLQKAQHLASGYQDAQNDSILAQLELVAQQVREADAEWLHVQNDSMATDSAITAAADRLRAARQEQEAWLDTVRHYRPAYFDLHFTQLSVDIDSVRNWLQPGNLLIEYYWGNAQLYAMGISRDTVTIAVLPIDGAFKRHCEAMLESCSEVRTGKQSYDQFVASSNFLYQKLIEPHTRAREQQPNYLYLIPDGELTGLPFDALLTEAPATDTLAYKQLAYLSRQTITCYHWATNLLVRQRHTLKNDSALIMAYAVNGQRGADRVGALDAELKGASLEAINAHQRFGGALVTGKPATRQAFLNRARGKQILYLSMHGQASRKEPAQSKLLFDAGGAEAQHLYAHEIYDMPLSADLVVLSACETNVGKFEAGEGVFSLSRAFYHAGCRTVASSLWEIDDVYTAALMRDFNRHAAHGKPVAEAMYYARNNYLGQAQSYAAHPANWAGMIVIGEGHQPLREPSRTWLWLLLGMVALVVVVGINESR